MTRILALATSLLWGCSAPAGGRPMAPWPPPAGPLRVVIDTDARNEIDDHYAVALALGFPERLRIEGIVAAHFGKPEDIEGSLEDIREILKHAGMEGKIPVARGVGPLAEGRPAPTSDGIELILERARASTPEDPLWLVLLGAVTDAVAAFEHDPSIADRVIVFWHGRSRWPVECRNFNARKDPVAARRAFDLPSRFVLFDTGAQLIMPVEEVERRYVPLGPLGAHLREIRNRHPSLLLPDKGLFDLGDIAALVDPACAPWEKSAAPSVDEKLKYDFIRPRGQLIRIKEVDPARSFDLLEESLRRLKP